MLVEMCDLQASSNDYFPARRCCLPQDELKKCSLAATVGTDDTDPIATEYGCRQPANDNIVAISETHSAQVDYQFAGQCTGIEPEADLTRRSQSLAALSPHGLQRPHSPFIARAPRLDALANPRFFFGQLLVEIRRRTRLDFQQFFLFTLVGVE